MGIYENLKEVVGLVQKIDNLDLYRKILNLQAEVQQLAAESLEKDELIRAKDDEIRGLKDKLAFKARLVRDGEDYFEADEEGKPFGEPYCSHCWEVDQIPIHVRQNPIDRKAACCPRCKNSYNWRRRL